MAIFNIEIFLASFLLALTRIIIHTFFFFHSRAISYFFFHNFSLNPYGKIDSSLSESGVAGPPIKRDIDPPKKIHMARVKTRALFFHTTSHIH